MMPKRVPQAPTSVQLLLTRKCNLSCVHCSAAQFLEKEKEPELSTKEWINLLERLKEIQVFQMDISGGEIFLREDIFEILEAAVRCKFPKLSIVTNAALISAAVAGKLKRLGIKNAAVSLDGDEKAHDRIRGTGSFKKTFTGIRHLVAEGIIPEILFTPLKSNYKTVNDLVDLLYPLGIKKLSFNALHPTGRCKINYKDIILDTFLHSEEFHGLIEKVRGKYRDFKIADSILYFQSYSSGDDADRAELKSAGKEKKTIKVCSAGHSSCNITAGGWVIPCSELFDFKGGNVREKDILEIWKNSENFEKIRRLANISTGEIPYCRNCDYNIYCNAGCRADAYAVFGDLLAPHPFCPYWQEKEK
jgi:radical SAM protein with 4Fe4S-binding SPASM domain